MVRTTLFAFAFAASLSATPISQALALNARTWISGKGVDQAGCGPIATPCRTLQYAHDQTSAGGEIDVLDPAGYGAITINKAINIVNEGVGVAGALAQAGSNAITVSASSADDIVIRGLTVEGAKVGAVGIYYNSGKSLRVENCLIQNFVGASSPAGSGIYIDATAAVPNIFIGNTTASSNAYAGVYFSGTLPSTLTIDRLVATHNRHGVVIDTYNQVGSASNIVISNNIVSNNSQNGFFFIQKTGQSSPVTARLRVFSSIAANNGAAGMRVEGGVVSLAGNFFYNNVTDLEQPFPGVTIISSYGDNVIPIGAPNNFPTKK